MQITIDDSLYQELVEKVGKANISEYVQALLRPTLNKKTNASETVMNQDFTNLTGIMPFTSGKSMVTDEQVQAIKAINDSLTCI